MNELTFDKTVNLLTRAVETDNSSLILTALNLCVSQYAKNNDALLAVQVQKVIEELWKNSKAENCGLVLTALNTYIDSCLKNTPPSTLWSNPAVIRSCLTLANLVEYEGFSMDMPNYENLTRFLTKIPGISDPDNCYPKFLERAGRALLGENWDIVSTLCDIEVEESRAFQRIIFEIPSSVLQKPKQATPVVANTVDLPTYS